MFYILSDNNKINKRALIGQSAMVYCAGKPILKTRVFWITLFIRLSAQPRISAHLE